MRILSSLDQSTDGTSDSFEVMDLFDGVLGFRLWGRRVRARLSSCFENARSAVACAAVDARDSGSLLCILLGLQVIVGIPAVLCYFPSEEERSLGVQMLRDVSSVGDLVALPFASWVLLGLGFNLMGFVWSFVPAASRPRNWPRPTQGYALGRVSVTALCRLRVLLTDPNVVSPLGLLLALLAAFLAWCGTAILTYWLQTTHPKDVRAACFVLLAVGVTFVWVRLIGPWVGVPVWWSAAFAVTVPRLLDHRDYKYYETSAAPDWDLAFGPADWDFWLDPALAGVGSYVVGAVVLVYVARLVAEFEYPILCGMIRTANRLASLDSRDMAERLLLLGVTGIVFGVEIALAQSARTSFSLAGLGRTLVLLGVWYAREFRRECQYLMYVQGTYVRAYREPFYQ